VIECDTQEQIDDYWQRLAEDGEGGQCGWLKDRCGVSWQVVSTGINELFVGAESERGRRATLGMRKIDLAALRRAAAGVPVS